MKSLLSFVFVLLVTTSIAASPLLTTAANAQQTPPTPGDRDIGNGGDPIAAQFYFTIVNVVTAMESHPDKFSDINLRELRRVLNKLQVVSTETPLYGYDGHPRPAINNSQATMGYLIRFNGDRWLTEQNPTEKVVWATHELFSQAGLEASDNFMFSYQIIERLQKFLEIKSYALLAPDDNIREFDPTGSWMCQNRTSKKPVRADIQLDHYIWGDSPVYYVAFRYTQFMYGAYFDTLYNLVAHSVESGLSCSPIGGRFNSRSKVYGGYFLARVKGRNKISFDVQVCARIDTGAGPVAHWKNRTNTLDCRRIR